VGFVLFKHQKQLGGGGALYCVTLTFHQPPFLAAIIFSNWFLKSQGLQELGTYDKFALSNQYRMINKNITNFDLNSGLE
jgi:hypothetical protein